MLLPAPRSPGLNSVHTVLSQIQDIRDTAKVSSGADQNLCSKKDFNFLVFQPFAVVQKLTGNYGVMVTSLHSCSLFLFFYYHLRFNHKEEGSLLF